MKFCQSKWIALKIKRLIEATLFLKVKISKIKYQTTILFYSEITGEKNVNRGSETKTPMTKIILTIN